MACFTSTASRRGVFSEGAVSSGVNGHHATWHPRANFRLFIAITACRVTQVEEQNLTPRWRVGDAIAREGCIPSVPNRDHSESGGLSAFDRFCHSIRMSPDSSMK
jgi:hypothetical protein